MSELNIKQIEMELSEARKHVENLRTLERLEANPDWVSLIKEGYFRDEAARIVALKAEPNFIAAGKAQMKILNTLEAGVGGFQAHLKLIRQKGYMAEDSLADMEETYTEELQKDLV